MRGLAGARFPLFGVVVLLCYKDDEHAPRMQAAQTSSTVFAKLEQELVRRIVDRPRFEAFKKRLAKQQGGVRRRDACFHVFNDQFANLQRSDLEDG
jgi:hypothetical protein